MSLTLFSVLSDLPDSGRWPEVTQATVTNLKAKFLKF